MSDEVWSARAGSFDACAAQYDDVRPSYPAQAVDEILRFGELGVGARALEVGCGTGKATRLFLERGLRVRALEPGARLIEVARASCRGDVSFENAKLEDWALERGAYDLVFAAQSFHWVDQATGYTKVGEALRPGGTLALFWNRPRRAPGELQQRLSRWIAETTPALEELTPEVLGQVEQSIAAGIDATRLFGPPRQWRLPWSQRLPTARYLALLETYSAYAMLPVPERRLLLAGIAEQVDAAGGEIDVAYETVVHLARRT